MRKEAQDYSWNAENIANNRNNVNLFYVVLHRSTASYYYDMKKFHYIMLCMAIMLSSCVVAKAQSNDYYTINKYIDALVYDGPDATIKAVRVESNYAFTTITFSVYAKTNRYSTMTIPELTRIEHAGKSYSISTMKSDYMYDMYGNNFLSYREKTMYLPSRPKGKMLYFTIDFNGELPKYTKSFQLYFNNKINIFL